MPVNMPVSRARLMYGCRQRTGLRHAPLGGVVHATVARTTQRQGDRSTAQNWSRRRKLNIKVIAVNSAPLSIIANSFVLKLDVLFII